MHRQFDKDPTEFFSVVGAPYVRERVRESHPREHRLYDVPVSAPHDVPAPRRRQLKIGFATVCAGLGAVLLGMSLFASNGAARLGEIAFQAVKTK